MWLLHCNDHDTENYEKLPIVASIEDVRIFVVAEDFEVDGVDVGVLISGDGGG